MLELIELLNNSISYQERLKNKNFSLKDLNGFMATMKDQIDSIENSELCVTEITIDHMYKILKNIRQGFSHLYGRTAPDVFPRHVHNRICGLQERLNGLQERLNGKRLANLENGIKATLIFDLGKT